MHAKTENFLYGVCYYPEAWDPSRHASDLDRIKQCGFNFVRLGEGAWNYWEPEEGKYQFSLFDRVFDLCAERKLKIVLGTPTYAAPAWVASNYPEVLRWNFERIFMAHGSRRNLNLTSPKMLDLSDRLCAALAEHFRDRPELIGWQLDNEFNCHMDVSYSPSDTIAFREWCRQQFKTLDALNESWGTKFWSQTYSDWEQIDLPHPTATYLNPSLLLDESRFISDTVILFARRQADILRARNRNWFITHNGLFNNVNGPDLAEELDFFSHDQYPLFYKNWTSYAEPLLQARSLSFPFGILEQQAGPGGQMQYFHRTPRAGEMRLWAWQSILHGANLLSFFRWRTCPYGSEQHWHGLLDADDRDNRRIVEAKQIGEEVSRLPVSFFDAPPTRSVAVLRDFDNEINDRRINTYIGTARGEFKRWVAELLAQHIPVDQIWPKCDFTGYNLIILPHQKIMDDALLVKLTAFVTAGGIIFIGAQSGLKDRKLHIVESTPPGMLASLAGIEIEDWTILPEEETRGAVVSNGRSVQLGTFVERLRLNSAQSVANWKTDDTLLAGGCAMSIHRVGIGQVIYLGGYCPELAVKTLCEWLIDRFDLPRTIDAPAEVEAIVREADGKRFLCLLNHSNVNQIARGSLVGTDLLSGENVGASTIELPPFGVRVIQGADSSFTG